MRHCASGREVAGCIGIRMPRGQSIVVQLACNGFVLPTMLEMIEKPEDAYAVSELSAETILANERMAIARTRFATPDGEVERVVVRHPGAVAIVASPAPGQVLLVRQHRYPIARTIYEIPAGTRVPE